MTLYIVLVCVDLQYCCSNSDKMVISIDFHNNYCSCWSRAGYTIACMCNLVKCVHIMSLIYLLLWDGFSLGLGKINLPNIICLTVYCTCGMVYQSGCGLYLSFMFLCTFTCCLSQCQCYQECFEPLLLHIMQLLAQSFMGY